MAKTYPGPARHQEDWDKRLGVLIHDVSRIRRVVFDVYVRALGLTRSQWSVLACLCRHDGMTQSDLATELDIGKSGLGDMLDRVEAAGLIQRRSDTTDRRTKRVYLSAQGKALNKAMSRLSHEMSEQILEGLDDQERHLLVGLLSVVKHNLVALRCEARQVANGAFASRGAGAGAAPRRVLELAET